MMENSFAVAAKVEEWMEKLAYCQSSVDDDDSRRVLSSDPALFELLDKKIAEVSAQISQLKTINYYDYPKTHGQGFAQPMIKDNSVSEVEGIKPALPIMTDAIYESIDWKHKGDRHMCRIIISNLKDQRDRWSNSDHWINVLEKRLSEEEAAMGQEAVDDDNKLDDMEFIFRVFFFFLLALDPKLDPLYNPPELVAKVLNERKRLFAKRPDDDTCIPPLDIYITAEQLLNFCEEEEEKGEQLVAITRPPNRRSNICTTPEHDQDMDTDCEYSVSDEEDEDIYDLEDENEEKTLPAAVPAPAYTPPPPLPPLTPLGLADIELMCPSIKGLHWQSVIF